MYYIRYKMDRNLFERFQPVSQEVKHQFIDALVSKTIEASDIAAQISAQEGRNYTQKYLINDYLKSYFSKKQVNLTREDGGQLDINDLDRVNKPPVKLVGYGAGNAIDVPAVIPQNLSGWENFYSLSGIWNEKNLNRNREPDKYENRTVVELVCDLIENGIKQMKRVHENVSLITNGEKEYVTSAKMPYSSEIRKDIQTARQKVNSSYNIFRDSVQKYLKEIQRLEIKKTNMPLFSTPANDQTYNDNITQLNQVIAAHPFAEEFIRKYDAYNNTNIRQYLR